MAQVRGSDSRLLLEWIIIICVRDRIPWVVSLLMLAKPILFLDAVKQA